MSTTATGMREVDVTERVRRNAERWRRTFQAEEADSMTNRLTDNTLKKEKVRAQVANNSGDQLLSGHFGRHVADALVALYEQHQSAANTYFSDPGIKTLFDQIVAEKARERIAR